MSTIKNVDITTIHKGALIELANEDLKDILANVLDPNTEPTEIRKLTIEIKIKPNENRQAVVYSISTKTKTAPAKGVSGMILVGMENGDVVAMEANANQTELDFTKEGTNND